MATTIRKLAKRAGASLQLHIELRGSKPKIWRRVLVPETITLAKLTVKHEDPIESAKTHKKTTFTLTMIDLKLGCAISGDIPIGGGSTNGGGG